MILLSFLFEHFHISYLFDSLENNLDVILIQSDYLDLIECFNHYDDGFIWFGQLYYFVFSIYHLYLGILSFSVFYFINHFYFLLLPLLYKQFYNCFFNSYPKICYVHIDLIKFLLN